MKFLRDGDGNTINTYPSGRVELIPVGKRSMSVGLFDATTGTLTVEASVDDDSVRFNGAALDLLPVRRVVIAVGGSTYDCDLAALRDAMRREQPSDGYDGYLWSAVVPWAVWRGGPPPVVEKSAPVLETPPQSAAPPPVVESYRTIYIPDLDCLFYVGDATQEDWHLRNQALPDFTREDMAFITSFDVAAQRDVARDIGLINKIFFSTAVEDVNRTAVLA